MRRLVRIAISLNFHILLSMMEAVIVLPIQAHQLPFVPPFAFNMFPYKWTTVLFLLAYMLYLGFCRFSPSLLLFHIYLFMVTFSHKVAAVISTSDVFFIAFGLGCVKEEPDDRHLVSSVSLSLFLFPLCPLL